MITSTWVLPSIADWIGNSTVKLDDQTLLPKEIVIFQCVQQDVEDLLPVCVGQCIIFGCGVLG